MVMDIIWPVETPIKATLGSPCDPRISWKCLLLPLAQQGAQQDPTQKGLSASRQKRADDGTELFFLWSPGVATDLEMEGAGRRVRSPGE